MCNPRRCSLVDCVSSSGCVLKRVILYNSEARLIFSVHIAHFALCFQSFQQLCIGQK